MFAKTIISVLAVAGAAVASKCTSQQRLASAKQVIYAYNLPDPGASAAAFKKVPWGDPDSAGGCVTTIIADGTCPVPVATTGAGTYQFAVESRQVFSHLTGEYVDFPNGTVLINTNVTLGARDKVPVPVTFTGHVYMDYDVINCRIYQARAYAQVPISVLNQSFTTQGLPSLPPPLCGVLPVKREIEFDA